MRSTLWCRCASACGLSRSLARDCVQRASVLVLMLALSLTTTTAAAAATAAATTAHCSTFLVLDGLLCYEPLSQALAAMYRTFYGLRDKEGKVTLVSHSALIANCKQQKQSCCGAALQQCAAVRVGISSTCTDSGASAAA
jgi:alkaline phosphatase